MNLILVKEKYEAPKPMFNQCPLCYNSKTSEKFLISLGSTKREHRSDMDQHGIIYSNYEIINMMWNDKQADISKGQSYFMTKFPHPTGNQSIDQPWKSIGWSLYDKDLHHKIIKIIWNSVIVEDVFPIFSTV